LKSIYTEGVKVYVTIRIKGHLIQFTLNKGSSWSVASIPTDIWQSMTMGHYNGYACICHIEQDLKELRRIRETYKNIAITQFKNKILYK
jgi:hypothetical protein